MNSSHSAVLNTLTRVQRFLDQHGDALGTINQSGYRAILDDVVHTLSGHAVNQTTSKRVGAAETAKERVLRNTLKVNHMRPIAAVAAAQLRQVPDFLALKMPPRTSSSRALIAWAGAMGNAAATYGSTFVQAGLPADFLAGLQGAAAALSTAIALRGATKNAQTGATAGLDAEATRGRQAVKVLDTLVEPLIAGNIALLTQWNAAKKFGGKAQPISEPSVDAAAKGPASPQSKPSPEPTDGPPPQPAPAPAPQTAANPAPVSTP
jgi:hypothetical protein